MPCRQRAPLSGRDEQIVAEAAQTPLACPARSRGLDAPSPALPTPPGRDSKAPLPPGHNDRAFPSCFRHWACLPPVPLPAGLAPQSGSSLSPKLSAVLLASLTQVSLAFWAESRRGEPRASSLAQELVPNPVYDKQWGQVKSQAQWPPAPSSETSSVSAPTGQLPDQGPFQPEVGALQGQTCSQHRRGEGLCWASLPLQG